MDTTVYVKKNTLTFSPDQKAQIGVLRAILYGVLNLCPAIYYNKFSLSTMSPNPV